MFHLARHRVGRRGIAVDVERRRIIAVDRKRRGGRIARGQQAINVCVNLGGGRVITENSAVAADWRWLTAHEVVVFIGDYQEQRVVLGDAGGGKPREERAEGLVIGLELV